MSDKDLRRNPKEQRGNERFWWYETPHGIEVYSLTAVENLETPSHIRIPWSQIKGALARKERKP